MQYDPQLMQELFRIMKTPAGRQLITMLQERGGNDLNIAINNAANGDYHDAKKMISSLLEDPDTRKLIDQLGGK